MSSAIATGRRTPHSSPPVLRRTGTLDLSFAQVLFPEKATDLERKAVEVFLEEVEKRTRIRLQYGHAVTQEAAQVIFIGASDSLRQAFPDSCAQLSSLKEPGPEGYRILARQKDLAEVIVAGADARGVFFGVGKLLRLLHLTEGSIGLDAALSISSTPRFPIRGHQLGYRPINNTYDAWTLEQFSQYIRELALFGANTIEILPGGTDEEDVEAARRSTCHGDIPEDHTEATAWPHMKSTYLEMMVGLSGMIHSYGMDVTMWWPNMFKPTAGEKRLREELDERERIFRSLPHLENLLIPGGDPGLLAPDQLFRWSGRVAEVLHRYHPKAKIWLSLQAFRQPDEWVEAFCAQVQREPAWLGGIVFAPWQKTPLPELRRLIPEKYPIRLCPDITHTLNCQFPVPQWDRAFAMTEGRECINPEPRRQKEIHNQVSVHASGSIGYSDGINDDVNKFVWSGQDWDPQTPVEETLLEYGRLFAGPEVAESIAEGLLALERNWKGPLLKNEGVEETLTLWQRMESSASPALLGNYRFQLGLWRAYADAYLRRRLLHEIELERQARAALREHASSNTLKGVERAEAFLRQGLRLEEARALRARCDELAEALHQSIGAQFSVQKHQALAWNRAGFMETLDLPLNDSAWLLEQFKRVRKCRTEPSRREMIRAILERTDPGPGGRYDNFGSAESMYRAGGAGVSMGERDPGNLQSPFINFAVWNLHLHEKDLRKVGGPVPLAWITNVSTLYGTPLTLKYDGLDSAARYLLRVTYMSNFFGNGKVRLSVNGGQVLEAAFQQRKPVEIKEYTLPQSAFSDGSISLTWTASGGFHGPNIAEVWIEPLS